MLTNEGVSGMLTLTLLFALVSPIGVRVSCVGGVVSSTFIAMTPSPFRGGRRKRAVPEIVDLWIKKQQCRSFSSFPQVQNV